MTCNNAQSCHSAVALQRHAGGNFFLNATLPSVGPEVMEVYSDNSGYLPQGWQEEGPFQ